ncbi:hypothetical protein NPIL_130421 [Nephila pilipes]|uniref:Uncharacterized protein n=1 Tax=Nephila pilipes TaxID=299642 RepID=A0A8X6TA28_NEPPI|nr:hypothetical protein NPIL_130421 [Nephila pilipes]
MLKATESPNLKALKYFVSLFGNDGDHDDVRDGDHDDVRDGGDGHDGDGAHDGGGVHGDGGHDAHDDDVLTLWRVHQAHVGERQSW